MKKNSSTNWKIKIILILSIILAALISYIVVNEKYYSDPPEEQIEEKNNEDNNENNENNKNIRDLTQVEIDILKNQIEKTSQYFAQYFPINSIDNISNQDLLQNMYIISESSYPSFSATQIDETTKKYFGNNKKIIHEDILCQYKEHEALYLYDVNTHSYNYNINHAGHGGTAFISRTKAFEVKGIIENENIVTVTAKILYGNYCSDTCIGGYSYYASIPNESALLLFQSTEPEEFIITDEKYNEVANQVPITTFTFEKDSEGNYGLKAVEFK